jgi:phosphatidylglycerophosphate synthase
MSGGFVHAEREGTDAARLPGVAVKARDCWWTVLVIDPLAAPMIRALLPIRRVTPNMLTAVAALVGVLAGAAFAMNQLLLGGVVFQLSFLVDCMDGKLAHTRGDANRYGPYLDAVGDAVRFAACTGGLVFGLIWHETSAVGWMTMLAMFPTLHYARLATQAAWPDRQRAEPLVVPASAVAFLRVAPRRLSKPGTTVDTEALAFTIGPVLGIPLLGVLVALAVDSARLIVSLAIRVRQSTRG